MTTDGEALVGRKGHLEEGFGPEDQGSLRCIACDKNNSHSTVTWMNIVILLVALNVVLLPVTLYNSSQIAELRRQIDSYEQEFKWTQNRPPGVHVNSRNQGQENSHRDKDDQVEHLFSPLTGPADQNNDGAQVGSRRFPRALDKPSERIPYDVHLETTPHRRHHGHKGFPGQQDMTALKSYDGMIGDGPNKKNGKRTKGKTKAGRKDRHRGKPVNLHLQAKSIGIQPLGTENSNIFNAFPWR